MTKTGMLLLEVIILQRSVIVALALLRALGVVLLAVTNRLREVALLWV